MQSDFKTQDRGRRSQDAGIDQPGRSFSSYSTEDWSILPSCAILPFHTARRTLNAAINRSQSIVLLMFDRDWSPFASYVEWRLRVQHGAAGIRKRHIAAGISRACNKARRKMSKLETETKREVHNVRVSYVTINCTRRQTLISPMAPPRYEITATWLTLANDNRTQPELALSPGPPFPSFPPPVRPQK